MTKIRRGSGLVGFFPSPSWKILVNSKYFDCPRPVSGWRLTERTTAESCVTDDNHQNALRYSSCRRHGYAPVPHIQNKKGRVNITRQLECLIILKLDESTFLNKLTFSNVIWLHKKTFIPDINWLKTNIQVIKNSVFSPLFSNFQYSFSPSLLLYLLFFVHS